MATAQPVLVTADLNDHEQISAWCALNIPTYEFIGRPNAAARGIYFVESQGRIIRKIVKVR